MVQLLLLENYIPTTSYESIANNLPQRSKQQSSVNRNNIINIPVVNNSVLNISNPHEPINADYNAPRKLRNQRQYDIPVFISTNVRKLDNKLDEIREVSIQNNAKVICITETWLTTQVPDYIIAMRAIMSFERIEHTQLEEGCVCISMRASTVNNL